MPARIILATPIIGAGSDESIAIQSDELVMTARDKCEAVHKDTVMQQRSLGSRRMTVRRTRNERRMTAKTLGNGRFPGAFAGCQADAT